jgi:hypothetical protein
MSDNQLENSENSVNEVKQKKDYDSPRVTVYGDLRDLTMGGARGGTESNSSSHSTRV